MRLERSHRHKTSDLKAQVDRLAREKKEAEVKSEGLAMQLIAAQNEASGLSATAQKETEGKLAEGAKWIEKLTGDMIRCKARHDEQIEVLSAELSIASATLETQMQAFTAVTEAEKEANESLKTNQQAAAAETEAHEQLKTEHQALQMCHGDLHRRFGLLQETHAAQSKEAALNARLRRETDGFRQKIDQVKCEAIEVDGDAEV